VRLGIRAKLFLVSLLLITTSVAVADFYLTRALERDLTERVRSELFVRLALIEHAVELAAPRDAQGWDALADQLGTRSGGRVTVIRSDGVVLGDSELDLAGIARVENHAHRPEVVQSLARGHGANVRYSTTMRLSMLYAAVPYSIAGQRAGVVRLARPLTEVDAAIARLRSLVLGATVIALVVAVLMSSLAAHWVSRSVRVLTAAAQRMAGGDLAARVRPVGRDEIAGLGRALDQLAGNLASALGELRTERDLLSRVLRDMREGVLLLDREGRVALANPALREMLLLEADLVGRLLLELVRNAELKRLLDEAEEKNSPVSGEIELDRLKPRRLLVHATALPDDPGGLLAVFVDVTDIRRLESMRRDFVANVSHELRTPIAVIRSSAETVARAIETSPDAALEFVQIIERQAERLQRLVEDLLDLSRIESRQYRLALEPVAVDEAVGHAFALMRERAAGKHIRLASEITSGTQARGDYRALEQVLSNLVDNAVKYVGEGGSVVVRAAPQGNKLRISVEDDGPGIEAKHLPRLFERFYRVDAGRSRDLGGTGLGLSIVKHLVEAMGGQIDVTSAPGRGTVFAFTLPTTPSAVAELVR